MISLIDVSVTIDDVTLLAPQTLEVAAGRAVAVRGPNGAGKTTLLRVCAGLMPPTSGAVAVAGMHPDQRVPEFRQALATYLDPLPRGRELTVLEQLTLIALSWGSDDPEAQAKALLDEFDIATLSHRFEHELSSGQRQLSSLAAACARPFRALLLDEPEQRLDPDRLSQVAANLRRRVDQGATILLATHSAWLADNLCDFEHTITAA